MHTSPNQRPAERSLRLTLGLTAGLFIIELVGGFLANSLALLSDAGHMLTDVTALFLALWAFTQARRPPDSKRTFGYRRLEILAALANGILLLLIVGVIAREAWNRLRTPVEIRSGLMLGVASLGLLVNLAGLLLLRREQRENLNVRAAFLHVASDALGSLGAIGAALLVRYAGWAQADAFVSLGIALLILVGSARLLRESLHYLLEGTPQEIQLPEVETCLRRFAGVLEVHDLHVWRISSGMDILTAHVVVEDPASSRETRIQMRDCLRIQFGLAHTTLEIEGPEELGDPKHEQEICGP